jgi:hypothetical protein
MKGMVEEMYVTAKGSAQMERVEEVRTIEGCGIEGDRYCERAGFWTRFGDVCQVTLIEGEDLDYIEDELGIWVKNGEHILGGTLAQPLDPDKLFQQVAVEDVGAFATIAFEHPDEWIGLEVDLAGDEQTMPEIAETFGRVLGREISYYQVPWDQFEEQMGEEGAVMYRWFNDVGYEADIAALRQEYPELTTFERYLRSHGWEGAELPARG